MELVSIIIIMLYILIPLLAFIYYIGSDRYETCIMILLMIDIFLLMMLIGPDRSRWEFKTTLPPFGEIR